MPNQTTQMDGVAAAEGAAILRANSTRLRRPKRPAPLKRRDGPIGPDKVLETRVLPRKFAVPKLVPPPWLEAVLK